LYGLKKDDIVTVTFDSGNDNDYIIGGTGTFFEIEQLIDLTAIAAIAGRSKTITKVLPANVTADGQVADLAFTGLTPGKRYLLSGVAWFRALQGDLSLRIFFSHDNATLCRVGTGNAGASNPIDDGYGFARKFTATVTTITASI